MGKPRSVQLQRIAGHSDRKALGAGIRICSFTFILMPLTRRRTIVRLKLWRARIPGEITASASSRIRHRLTLSLTYAIPGRRPAGRILEGWQVKSIVSEHTGQPGNVVDTGNDISRTGEGEDRWNILGSPAAFTSSSSGPIPSLADGTQDGECGAHALASQLQQFGCFAKGNSVMTPPDPGMFSSMARNSFRGLAAWDLSLAKDWGLAERLKVQFRAESFDVLHHPDFANPRAPARDECRNG